MVEEVTRIETTGTGSATPSSSPTPKVSRWEQLDPSARTGATPVVPTPVRSDAADGAPPTVRPLSLPDTAKPPRVNFGGQNFGFTKTNVGGFPFGIRNTPEWRVGGGTSRVSRGATGFLNYAAGMGQPNLKSQFMDPVSGKVSGRAALGYAALGTISALMNAYKGDEVDPATDTTLNEQIAAAYEDMGYPADIAKSMAKDTNLWTNLSSVGIGLGTAAVADTSAGVIGAGIGAVAGSVVPGFGTAAGAAAGWAAGTTISGISTLVNMFIEAPFKIDVPTVDDLWGFKDLYGASGELAYSAADTMIKSTAAGLHPDRLRGNDEVLLLQNKVMSGAYATGKEPDPRGQEMADLVAQGYFIKTKPDGTQGIDIVAYQQFQLDTMMYKQPQDMQKYLPRKTAEPRTIDQTEWIRLWSNAE